jgi:uncharacterized membrane protein
MKKTILLSALVAFVIAISCTKKVTPSKTNEAAVSPPKVTVTYAANIKTLIQAKCTPCHIPAKGGFKAAFDTYDAAKKYIDDMIRRIQLDPTQKDYMPFKFPKLSTEDVEVFKKWKEAGLAE